MKRALLIGCQTGGLTGVDGDLALINEALSRLGFSTTRITGPEATAAGIRTQYRSLIDSSRPDDAAVVYYSGHGGRVRDPAATDSALPEWLQFLVPSDAHEPDGEAPRVILAEELHLLGRRLTARTQNATVVLDCCHAARMSRDGFALPRADPSVGLDLETVAAWRTELRHRAEADGVKDGFSGDANPDLVRVVGCSPNESSFELRSAAFGGRVHGALTAALASALASPAVEGTWHDVLDIVRRQVLGRVPGQRPDVEGPADRLPFSLERRSTSGVLAVQVEGGVAAVADAALLGVGVGNTYTLTGTADTAPIDTAEVVSVVSGRAVLRTERVPVADLPAGVVARPLRVALGARPVAVLPASAPGRNALVAAIEGSPYLRVVDQAEPQDAALLAKVQLLDAGVEVLDEAGLPLYGRPVAASDPARVATDLTTLARAAHVRDLESGAGDAELPDDVELVALQLSADGAMTSLDPGEHLFVGDRIAFRSTNRGGATRYASVLDVGITGRIAVLNSAEPGGTTLDGSESYTLGTDLLGTRGFELFWPENVPDAAPRRETFVMVVADRKVDGLVRLEQEGVRGRSRALAERNALEQLIDDVMIGVRDARPAGGRPALRYRVARLDVVFHPTPRPDVNEPPFIVDERPDPSFRLVLPRRADAPSRVAVRLKELSVISNRSFLRARVRVDALVVTAVPVDAGAPYAAGTARFDRVQDGDRLPFDDLLVYEGPVGRFLDIAVWVSRDDARDRDLSELLATEVSGKEVAGAITALAGLAVAAPAAALVAGSAAAVAVLVRTAARAIDVARGTSIGTYRTSLLPHQRFGAPPPPQRAARHPGTGVIEAQDMRFAFEVVDLD